jgi:4-azaleucine resistance transporter AzlC
MNAVRWLRLPARHRRVAAASVTLALATGIFAVSFGVLAVSAGASVAQTCAMSLLVFTGASQLSAVSVIAAGGSTGSALGGALLLAARNGVYGLTMAGRLKGRLATRLVAAQLTLDETTAMATAQEDPEAQRAAFWITGVSIYVFWNVGTLVGALAGSAIGPETYGLDGAFPAAFVGMLWPQLRTVRGRVAALIAAALIAAIVVKDTFSTGQDVDLDARAAGVVAAGVAAWRKAPIALVVVIGAAVTAAVRALA